MDFVTNWYPYYCTLYAREAGYLSLDWRLYLGACERRRKLEEPMDNMDQIEEIARLVGSSRLCEAVHWTAQTCYFEWHLYSFMATRGGAQV